MQLIAIKESTAMPDLTHYSDYRKFLAAYYDEMRKKDPKFSFLTFSWFAGIKSKGFLYNVIAGKRNLNNGHIASLSRALRLKKFETDYFKTLVKFNQSTKTPERGKYYEKLSAIKSKGRRPWTYQVLRKDQYEFYSKYHHSVIRSLIGLFGFTGDFKQLGEKVYPTISPRQARLSVELLLRLGLIKKVKGTYRIIDKSISTPPEIERLAVLNFHKQTLELALKSLLDLPGEKRNISSITLGLSPAAYQKLCTEIETFRFHLLQIEEADKGSNGVYQLNFQLFPVSKNPGDKKRKT